jgi:hypothetical protein
MRAGESQQVAATDIEPEEVDWIKAHADEVRGLFGGEFDNAGTRFKDSPKPLQRFSDAITAMLANGRALVSGVDEAHNELCVASQLLANPEPRFTLLEYEPALTGCAKSIDFRATARDGLTLFVDVKTIKPKPKDRWDQFEKACKNGWFPENVHVTFGKEWLGGEIWHGMFAARARMLEYALGLEAKIRDCNLAADNTFFILCLCGEGFHWHQDGLEDFVAFYRTGSHRGDDPFSKAEAKYIADNGITLDRTITRFACMNRPNLTYGNDGLSGMSSRPAPPVFGA